MQRDKKEGRGQKGKKIATRRERAKAGREKVTKEERERRRERTTKRGKREYHSRTLWFLVGEWQGERERCCICVCVRARVCVCVCACVLVCLFAYELICSVVKAPEAATRSLGQIRRAQGRSGWQHVFRCFR